MMTELIILVLSPIAQWFPITDLFTEAFSDIVTPLPMIESLLTPYDVILCIMTSQGVVPCFVLVLLMVLTQWVVQLQMHQYAEVPSDIGCHSNITS